MTELTLVSLGRPLDGMTTFIRYAFMPNRLEYCGGDDNQTLFDYALAGFSDNGLAPLLQRFTGALPYLRLIANANNIRDVFDSRVVEAYWLGNALLDAVEVRQFYDTLLDRFGKQLSGRTRDLVLGKAPSGARPHHSFHVLDVHSRIGALENTMQTLDSCRISWGWVIEVRGSELVVNRQRLLIREGKLTLNEARPERVLRQINGRGFADDAAPGSWVSLHWGWVCEVITEQQHQNVERYTRYHLALANRTI